jgi:hypothetical protein
VLGLEFQVGMTDTSSEQSSQAVLGVVTGMPLWAQASHCGRRHCCLGLFGAEDRFVYHKAFQRSMQDKLRAS